MAIFDGLGDLVPAPDDKGVYNRENEIPIVPLPKSIVLPKVKDEGIVLPDDQKDTASEGIEILDDGEYFPEASNNLTPIKEDLKLPTGQDIVEIIDDASLPIEVDLPEIDDTVLFPIGQPIVIIDESALQETPEGVDLPSIDEDLPSLPISTESTLPAEDILILSPKDVNTYLKNGDEETAGSLEGVIIRPQGINYSDTIIDRLFTKITDVLDFVRVPVPESVISLYSKIQEIEGYLSDPKSFAIQVRENILGLLLGSNVEDRFDPKVGVIMRPTDNRANLIMINGNQYDISGTSEALARNNEIAGILEGQNILTEGYVNAERFKQISDDILESQFAFQGRKSTVGVTLRLTHLWDLRFEPYNDPELGIECVLPDMYDHISTAYENALAKKTSEKYLERDKDGNSLRENPLSDWEDSLPVLSYDLDYLALASRDLELYGGSTISIPEIIKRNSLITTQILDDENKRWRRWFQRALDTMCPPPKGEVTTSGASNGSVVVPYKNCCMKATLYQYRTDSHILSHKVFLVLLKNYQVTSTGAGGGAGSPDVIDAEWSIVGEITQYAGAPVKKYANRSQRKKDHPDDTSTDKIETAESKKYPGKYINIV